MKTNVVKLNRVNLNIIGLNGYVHKGNVGSDAYIKFKDPVVAQICATKWGDGIGLTKEQASSVTSIEPIFRENAEIEYFDELKYFTNVTSLQAWAFYKCTNLKSISLPPNILTVDVNCLSDCSNLESISIPKSVENIEPAAFRFSPVNYVLDLPNLKELGRTAFRGTGITKIVNLGNVDNLSGDYIFAQCHKLTEAYIPEHIKILGSQLFEGCKNLTIAIPTHITSIGAAAFNSVTISNDIDLPNLETLGDNAFASSKITKVYNLGKITSLNYGTFLSCPNLEYVEIPSTITSINEWALGRCPKLETCIVKANTPPTLGVYSFEASTKVKIFVPDESLADYKAATNWTKYDSQIKPLSELINN